MPKQLFRITASYKGKGYVCYWDFFKINIQAGIAINFVKTSNGNIVVRACAYLRLCSVIHLAEDAEITESALLFKAQHKVLAFINLTQRRKKA